LSVNTRPTGKNPKTPIRNPGDTCGPMKLPVSYNIYDYKVKPDDSKPGRMRVVRPIRKRSASGANRYSSNKLLSEGPIK
jgi:hypothetical protein